MGKLQTVLEDVNLNFFDIVSFIFKINELLGLFSCWALWSLVVFDPDDDPTQNDVAGFLMADFLRLSPWSRGFLDVVFE